MSFTLTTANDLDESTRDQLMRFVQSVGVDARYRKADAGPIESLTAEMLKLDDGMVTDSNNYLAFVFDPPEVPKRYLTNQRQMDTPAESYEIDTHIGKNLDAGKEVAIFEFPNGNRTAIQTGFFSTFEDVLGFDPLEEPGRILSHETQNGWPVLAEADGSNAYVMAAPIAMDY